LTSKYNRWPTKAGPSRRHFGRAVDRSIDDLFVGICTRVTLYKKKLIKKCHELSATIVDADKECEVFLVQN